MSTLYFKSTIFLVLILALPLTASETLHNWVKTHRWDLVENYFKTHSPSRESEVYSLIEYHDKAPEADPEKRFLYLVSQVKGSFVKDFRKEYIQEIIQNPLPFQSVVYKLSFWKLGLELDKRNLWTQEEKALYLAKLNHDTDPVSQKVAEELARVYLDLNKPDEIVKFIDKLPRETKNYYLQTELYIRYAKALARTGNLGKAKDEYIQLAKDPATPDYIRSFVYKDLKSYLSADAFLGLQIGDVFSLLNVMERDEANHFLKNNKMAFRSRIEDKENFRQAGLYLAKKNEIGLLKSLVLSNKIYFNKDSDYLGEWGIQLYYDKKYKEAIEFLESFPDIDEPGKYRVLTLSYNKLQDSDRKFKNLVLYLKLFPFNLYYQDMLLDELIGTDTNRSYAPKTNWLYALDNIPDLPVKGRLFYWYLRYLKDSGNSQELEKRLEDYYEKIAGSYYTRVIREEFSDELGRISVPSNPTENKKSLYRYLSHTAGIPEISGKITKKNLGFAFFEKSFDLGVRLTNVQSKVRGDRILSLATDYFRLGEDRLGMNLIHFYAREKNLTTTQKEETIVGVGELAQNTYYSAFYARSLLKRLNIPDDPILLPTTVSVRIYPRPHRDLVRKYSQEARISEDVVYAIMRQESFYKENAVSRSNAQGLMQIMPATGRELARKLGVSSYSLFNPDTSIRFGSQFLGYLMRTNENELKWASIAYNGGPGNLRKWKRNHYKGDFNHFLEDIPYKESRDYSRIVVSNLYAYEIMKYYHGL